MINAIKKYIFLFICIVASLSHAYDNNAIVSRSIMYAETGHCESGILDIEEQLKEANDQSKILMLKQLRGNLEYSCKYIKSAYKTFSEILNIAPEDQGILRKYLMAYSEYAPLEAVNKINTIIQQNNKKNPYLFEQLGSCLYMLERYEEAITAYLKALSLNDHWKYRYNLAILLEKSGRYKESIAIYEQIVNQPVAINDLGDDYKGIMEKIKSLKDKVSKLDYGV